MDLAETEQERIVLGREVVSLLTKAFTNMKLYPHDHMHCVNAVQSFHRRVQSYTQLHHVLRLGITRESLTVEGEDVYTQEKRNENIAFRMYVDGVREVQFAQGVQGEEVTALIKVLYTAMLDPDQDCTLLLWEADFTNIDYVAISSLTDAWEAPDYFSADQLDLIELMNQDVDTISAALTHTDARETYSFELTDGAAEVETLLGDDSIDDGGAEKDDEGGDIFDVPEEALTDLRRTAMSWGPDRLLTTLVYVGLEGLANAPKAQGVENVRWLVQEAVGLAMRSRDMDLLNELLTRYDGELSLMDEDEGDESIFTDVFAWVGREENLERLVKMAQGTGVGSPQAFCKILSMLGETGVIAAVAALLEAETKELKDSLLAYLSGNVTKNPLAVLPMLDPELPAQMVKDGLYVVGKAVPEGEDLTKLLKAARRHEDRELKKYANHLWRTKTQEGRLEVHYDALLADNREDRVKALRALVEGRYFHAADRLKEVIASDGFLERDTEERNAFIAALGYMAGTRAVRFLQDQTRRSTMIFNRKAAKEIRNAAKQALDDLNRPGG